MRRVWLMLFLLFALPLHAFGLTFTGGSGGRILPPCGDVGGAHINADAAGVPFCGASSSGGAPGNAAADGATKGILALNASNFTCVSGICDLATTLAGRTLPNTTTATLKDTLFTLQDDGDTGKQVRFQLSGIPPATLVVLSVPPATDTLVGANSVATLLLKTLVSPVITTPSGIVPADVGLGNVANVSLATERSTTRTLTNATLDSTNAVTLFTSSFTLQDPVTPSKQARWSLAGNTASTLWTYTLFDASDSVVCLTCPQTPMTNKLISGADNTLTNISLATSVTGNLPVTRLNSGTSASASTFWRGDGSWATPAGGGNVSSSGTPVAGQAAEWTSATLIQGVTVTGSGSYVKGTSPALVTPTGLVKGDVGLGNVDNTSDATKNAAAVTLTNKTLTSPVINTPTGIVKGDVGLGNVDNTSDTTKNAAAVTLTNKTISGASNTLTNVPACATCTTNASALTANLPVIGAGGNAVAVGTSSGNTTAFVTLAGAATSGTCAQFDASGNVASTGSACGAGVGGTVTSVFGRIGVVAATSGDYTEAQISFTDITTNNATTLVHGYLPKLPGGTSTFLRADGTFATPAGAGNVSNSGTPTAGQAAEWVSSTVIAGVATTGTGSYVKATSPTLVTPLGIVKNDVGLGSVDNTSDVTKNAAAVTLTNKTLTAPVISSPTGIVKGDVGLGNVDNTSDTTKNAAAVTLTNKTISGAANTITNVSLSTGVTGNLPVTNLGGGTSASSTTFWRGDGSWAVPAGSGSVTITGTPVAGQAAEWTSASAIQGVTVTGTGSYVKGTNAALTTPTLTNATLTTPTITVLDTALSLQDNGDPSRQVQFQLGSLTAPSTRVFTFPDYSATFATVAGAETLTNKTLATALFTTSLTGPLVIGGTGTASSLTLQSTSGAGTTDSVLVKVGNTGAVTAMTVDTLGNVGLGVAPSTKLHLLGASAELRHTGSATNQTICHQFYDNNTTLEGGLCYQGALGAGSKSIALLSNASDGILLNNVNDVGMRLATNNTTKVTLASTVMNVGFNGAVNPAFRVDYSAASVATGVSVTGGAVGTAPVIASLSSGTNENLGLEAKGTGSILLHGASTGDVLIGGNSARVLGLNRHTTSNTAGTNLTVRAGGATTAATDKAGGDLVLAPGQTTGTGRDLIRQQCYKPATATGTGDNASIDCVIVGAVKRLANNTVTTVVSATIASNTSIAIELEYAVQARDGSSVQQVEAGRVICVATNVGGTVSQNACSKVGNVSALSNFPTSTLAVDWTITAANPALIQVNANSSLTNSTGFPVVHMNQITNLTDQALNALQ